MAHLIYKICTAAEWRDAIARGMFHGLAADLRDGFIHLSSSGQVAGTLGRHFPGQPDLLLIAFEPGSLGPDLRFEASRGGEPFPHLYGPLDPGLAVSVTALRLGDDGRHVLPASVR